MKRVIKGNIISYFILLAITISTMVFIKRCNINQAYTKRDYNEIANDTLRFITNIYFNDTIEGSTLINYELAELIGDESGLTYKIDTLNSLTESITLLYSNKYDIIARPIFATTKSKEELLFSNEISNKDNNLVVVQRIDGNIKSNLDLARKTVSIIDDESINMIIENIAYEIGDSIYADIKHNCSVEQLITMVNDSTIDYAVCGIAMAKRMKEFLPQIDIDTKISIPIPQAWGVRLSSPILRDSINIWLEKAKTKDKYKNIMNKYEF
ncbi:MAG: transporter substrate-binding domain-containing protein [Bacteroidales bacterium]|nr:transporter substrate-binding domain-containing protein [Bacteroidales bacterium]